MAVIESQVTALELERVLPKVRVMFEREDKFYSSIRKNGDVEIVSYRSMRIPLELRPGGAFQYFNPDGGDLGRGGGPTWDKATITPVFMSENLEYTKLAQWSTNNDRKSVVNGVRRMVASGLDELRRQIEAQLMQSGNGVIGVVSAVATASGVDTYTLGTDGFGAVLMRYGQTVQVYDTTLATLRGKGTITMHDVENKTIDVTPAVAGAVATDKLVVDGITSPNSLPALYGVPYHHSNSSSGTWLGFNRATTPEIRSNRVNAAGAGFSLPFPRLALSKIGNRSGEIPKSLKAWLHPAQMAAYEEAGQAIMMINKSNTKESLDLYFGDKQTLAGAPAMPSWLWDKTRIDFIDTNNWGRAEILPIGFYKTDGRQIFEIRGASGGVATADIFYMVVGMQIFVKNPMAESYIDNLAVPTGY